MSDSFCPWCGKLSQPGFRFCRGCGKELPAEDTPTPVQLPPAPSLPSSPPLLEPVTSVISAEAVSTDPVGSGSEVWPSARESARHIPPHRTQILAVIAIVVVVLIVVAGVACFELSEHGSGSTSGPPTTPPTTFMLNHVRLDYNYAGTSTGYLGTSGQDLCSGVCPLSYTANGSCRTPLIANLTVSITNSDTITHEIVGANGIDGSDGYYGIVTGTSSEGTYYQTASWVVVYLADPTNDSILIGSYELGPGQQLPYTELLVYFDTFGACRGSMPAGEFSIVVTLSTL